MISFIIAKYKDFEGVQSSLLSIEIQKVKCEVIIKDAVECELTLKFLSEQNFEYINVKYIASDDEGIYDAINQAFEYCSGTHIWVIGCGDIPHLNFVKTSALIPSCTYISSVLLFDGSSTKEYMGRLTPPHQGVIYCRSVYEALKYSLRYKIISDRIFYDDFIRTRIGQKISLHEPICTFLLNGVSSQKASKKLILFEMLKYCRLRPNYRNILRLASAMKACVWA